ncbi:hypothetical protein [Maribacter sp. 2307UL18-2]|uniref:hypothetical protein n=1 Tax=Maribacter sp. 2307UL18-2 TaxID=3386274 RepID=UPI0039BD27DB
MRLKRKNLRKIVKNLLVESLAQRRVENGMDIILNARGRDGNQWEVAMKSKMVDSIINLYLMQFKVLDRFDLTELHPHLDGFYHGENIDVFGHEDPEKLADIVLAGWDALISEYKELL